MKALARIMATVLVCVAAMPGLPAQQSIFGGPAPSPEAKPEANPAGTPPATGDGAEAAATPAMTPETRIALALRDWPLRRRVAQMILATMQGSNVPNIEDFALLKEYTPGGAVIRNLLKPESAVGYVQKLRGIEAATGTPLLVGADLFELSRSKGMAGSGFKQLPSLLSVAAANDPAATTQFAQLYAEHLAVLGFNLSLGPSLSLSPELHGARGSIYHFGSDPVFAAGAGTAIVAALRERNVIPMPMGFPGGGGNRTPKSGDSGNAETPAVLLTPPPLIYEQDLLPFQRAVEAGVPIINVGNTLTPTLDPANGPASLSKIVMTDILREKLGFKGVIVAGPLDAEDIAATGMDTSEAALRAIEAGADMLYFRGSDSLVKRVVDRIAGFIVDGKLPEGRINESVRRILSVKTNPDLFVPNELSDTKAEQLSQKGSIAKSTFAIETKAITLVRNRDNVLPLSKETSMPVGITGVVDLTDLKAALEKFVKPISEQSIATARHIGDIGDFEIARLTEHSRGMRTCVCVFTDDVRVSGQVRLVQELKGRNVRVVAILLGYPKQLEAIANAGADAILLAYCNGDAFEETVKAMAPILAGESPVSLMPAPATSPIKPGEKRVFNSFDLIQAPAGHLPVTISEAFPAGFAVSYNAADSVKKSEWDFGDGKREKKPSVEHSYEKPGDYTVTLTVTDIQGGTKQQSFTVSVKE